MGHNANWIDHVIVYMQYSGEKGGTIHTNHAEHTESYQRVINDIAILLKTRFTQSNTNAVVG